MCYFYNLRFNNVRQKDTGTYECTSINSYGSTTDYIQLQVLGNSNSQDQISEPIRAETSNLLPRAIMKKTTDVRELNEGWKNKYIVD